MNIGGGRIYSSLPIKNDDKSILIFSQIYFYFNWSIYVQVYDVWPFTKNISVTSNVIQRFTNYTNSDKQNPIVWTYVGVFYVYVWL